MFPRLFLIAVVLSACDDGLSHRSKTGEVESQSQAATTHLAVLSRKIFTEDVVKAISPNFTLDGETAYLRSVPLTGDFRELRSAAFKGSLQVEANPGSVATPGQETIASASDPKPIAEGVPALVAADARTTYSVATGLFQDVAGLNNYVRNYPELDQHIPYIVRLQLSVIPRRRNLPYDLYSDLSFFADLGPKSRTRFQRAADEQNPELVEQVRIVPAVPLFASEAVEAGRDQQTLERLRTAALSGAGSAGIFSLGGGLSAEEKRRLQALTQELNGLFTMGRVTENVVRVRLGAVQNATSSFEMIPRTHNITLLLMVPEGAQVVNIKAQQSMINVETHEPLPRGIRDDSFFTRIDASFKRFQLKKTPEPGTTDQQWKFLCEFRPNTKRLGAVEGSDEAETTRRREMVSFVLKRMREDVALGDFSTFKDRVRYCLERSDAEIADIRKLDFHDVAEWSRILWTELASIQADLPDSFARFEIPNYPDNQQQTPANSLADWQEVQKPKSNEQK